ncbi:hypothetical protein D3C84_710270 [compost metagenome]
MAFLQAWLAGDADDDFTCSAAYRGIRLRDQNSQHVVVEQRAVLGFPGGVGCYGGCAGHSIAGCQRHALGIAGFGLVGENPIALRIDVSKNLRRCRLGQQQADQQPGLQGLCTRCTVNVTLGLCWTTVSPSIT